MLDYGVTCDAHAAPGTLIKLWSCELIIKPSPVSQFHLAFVSALANIYLPGPTLNPSTAVMVKELSNRWVTGL